MKITKRQLRRIISEAVGPDDPTLTAIRQVSFDLSQSRSDRVRIRNDRLFSLYKSLKDGSYNVDVLDDSAVRRIAAQVGRLQDDINAERRAAGEMDVTWPSLRDVIDALGLL